MALLWSISCLLILSMLFSKTIGYTTKDILDKRIEQSTDLWHLTTDALAMQMQNNGDILGSKNEPWSDDSMYWALGEQRLISVSEGDFAVSMQSNMGAWLCVIEKSRWALINRGGEVNDRIYKQVWDEGCGKSLQSTMAKWQAELSKFELADFPGLRIFAAQVVAFGKSTKENVPTGYDARLRLVPYLKGVLGLDQIPLLGWPARTTTTTTVGFVVEQEAPQWSEENGYQCTVKIYSTGTGPKFGAKKNSPGWGTRPAITITLYSGLTWGDCGTQVIYYHAETRDDATFPSATAKDPANPYF